MNIKSIRSFIGASDYTVSRQFYTRMGFSEMIISEKLSYFHLGAFGFYLQDYFVKDWVNNSMLFLEVNDLDIEYSRLKSLKLTEHFPKARLSIIEDHPWGRVCFLHDPDGILWQIGQFNHLTKIE